jgi:hypothetical protein
VSSEKVPDDVGDEYPVETDIRPPVWEAVVIPEYITISPPMLESPVPTST